jgi:RNA polymerase sigma-70 factor (TIGR02960 family)
MYADHGTTELLARARDGDDDAFSGLVEGYRPELLMHCYRILGSLQDAEDALQETLVGAWRGLSSFEERSSIRTWLYQIATNRCLNLRRATQRRRSKEWDVPGLLPPAPTGLNDVVWLEPLPDHVTAKALGTTSGPDAAVEASESISLAFITALQRLPPRQVAVLVLRDVLTFRAAEVAEMLDTTVESVNSLLKRARAGLQALRAETPTREPAPAPGSPEEVAITARFARAYETANITALVELFTQDVFLSMPPMPLEYEGRELVGRFCAMFFDSGRTYRLVPSRANGQPAFGLYILGAHGVFHATGFMVLSLTADRICAMTRFETSVMARFGLPRMLAAEPG